MKHRLIRAFAFAVGSSLAFCVSTADAVTTSATGSYYATPSWDQQLPASTRFIVLSNWVDAAHPSGGAAVLDRETGLVWEQSPDTTQHDWYAAQFVCMNKNVGGRGGWKLPSIQELRSLVDPTASNPALPAGHPFTNVQSVYWSASTDAFVPANAWSVDFLFNGILGGGDKAVFLNFAWCVRGGPGVDAQ